MRKRRIAVEIAMRIMIYAKLLRVLTNTAILVTSKGHVRDSRRFPNDCQDLPLPS